MRRVRAAHRAPEPTWSASKRIMVYGVTGSGKTTLARQISERTGLPWTEIDSLTWEPNWFFVPEIEQRRRIEELCSRDCWVIDHAYSTWLQIPLARADMVVGLDYPRWLSLSRLLRRSVMRVVDKKPMCNGNTETLRHVVSRDSILVWHFRSFARKRDRLRAWETERSFPQYVRLTTPRATRAWLASLSTSPNSRERVDIEGRDTRQRK